MPSLKQRCSRTPASLDPRRSRFVAVVALTFVALLAALSPSAGASPSYPPTNPSDLTVTEASASSVTIKWQPSTADVGISGYSVFVDGKWLALVKASLFSAGHPLDYTVNGLSCGKSYTLGVLAFDIGGVPSPSTVTTIAATKPCVDTQPPSAPSGVAQIAKTANSATVSWSPSSDNIGVVGYGAYQAGIRVAQTPQASHTFSNLPCGANTTVGVDAYDAAGNRSAQSSFVVTTSACNDTQPPSVPTNLAKTASTETSVSFSWSPSSDNVGVASYSIVRDGAFVGSTTQTAYTISGLACGKSYSVGVAGWDAVGNHSANATASLATSACAPVPAPKPGGKDTQPPTVPTNLKVTGSTQTSVTVAWTKSTDNVGVAGYGAYNGSTNVGQTAQTTYTFAGLSCGKSLTFGVDAYDAAGNRSAKASVIASTGACSDTQPPSQPTNVTLASRTGTSISLTWSASSDNVGVVGYGVYKGGVSAGTTASTSYTVTSLACGTSYTIAVDAYDASGNRSGKATVMMATTACGDTQPPSAPSNLATSNVAQTSLTLSWAASTDNVGVAGYDVYSNGTKVGSAAATTLAYALPALSCGTSYTFGVEAFDAAGNRSARTTKAAQTATCPVAQTGSANLYVSPNGNDGNACTASAPCSSLNRAYQAAQPGQTIEVAGGTYGGQVIKSRASMRNLSPGCAPGVTQNCITFRPAAGATVTIGGPLEVRASGVYVNGSPGASFSGQPTDNRSYRWVVKGYTDTEADSASNYPDHVVFEGIDTTNFGAFNVDTATFKNMDVGPATVSSGCAIKEGPGYENKIGFGGGVTFVPKNVTIDGLLIHDQNGDAGRIASDCHFGGLFLVTVDGLVIRNSVFSQNVVYNIQVQNFSGPAPTNVTLENNWFGCSVDWLYNGTKCAGQADLQFNAASNFSNWNIRHNSFVSGIGQYVPGASYSNVTVAGNTGGRPSNCYAGMTFKNNAWVDGTCGSADKSIPSLPFVSTSVGGEDLHLTAGSGAIDAGSAASAPSGDIDGQSRPMGAAPDAGADERS